MEALAIALRRVLDDPATAARLVAAGSRRAEQFSMTALANLYLDRSRKLLAQP
ncbi:MAG: hypothetical protein WKF58_12370 [Ilumatobacteraceae bacterium]